MCKIVYLAIPNKKLYGATIPTKNLVIVNSIQPRVFQIETLVHEFAHIATAYNKFFERLIDKVDIFKKPSFLQR